MKPCKYLAHLYDDVIHRNPTQMQIYGALIPELNRKQRTPRSGSRTQSGDFGGRVE